MSAASPRSTSLIVNFVSFAQILMSHADAKSTPAPMQYPWIAAITGTLTRSKLLTLSYSGFTMSKNAKAARAASPPAFLVSPRFMADDRSSPAVKCLPSPVKMMHRTSLPVLPRFSMTPYSSVKIAQVIELNFLGRFMLTTAI